MHAAPVKLPARPSRQAGNRKGNAIVEADG
jgi:hypothetical protein